MKRFVIGSWCFAEVGIRVGELLGFGRGPYTPSQSYEIVASLVAGKRVYDESAGLGVVESGVEPADEFDVVHAVMDS